MGERGIFDKFYLRKILSLSLIFVLLFSLSTISMANIYAEPAPLNANPPSSPAGHVVGPAVTGAIIGNGDVILGVNEAGHLNVPYREVPALLLPAGDPAFVGVVGLRDGTGTFASTEPGCQCEGWGIFVPSGPFSGTTGFANNALGIGGVDVESFTGVDGGTTAVSKVSVPVTGLGAVLEVTHDYHPSPFTSKLYEVKVTVKNVSGGPLDKIIYRRVMDWDVAPTFFSEFVTIKGTASTTKLIAHGDNGFLTADPSFPGPYTFIDAACEAGDCTDSGPGDHGAVFDFDLGGLAAGESVSFKTFYGEASTETSALAALGAVGTELYSLGQSSTPDGPTLGTPATFMFAFEGVGGTPILPKPVGGTMIPIDTTALVIAGASTNGFWVLTILVAIAGASFAAIRFAKRDTVEAVNLSQTTQNFIQSDI